MSTVRLRRLQADFLKLQEYARRHPRVRLVQFDGDPPERYQISYRIRSLRQKDDELVEVDDHLVEIVLPRNYPRTPPQCRMLTPIFHPNIAPHAICIGDHWSAGETLSSIVARIGEMISYQSYNTKSPLNGEAARWVSEHLDELPLDGVSMDVEEPASAPAPPPRPAPSPAPAPAPPPAPAAAMPDRAVQGGPVQNGVTEIECPHCATRLRVPVELLGKQARCPRCQSILTLPNRVATS
jgi:ubiquitin-protein ligase